MDVGKRITYFRERNGWSVNKLANLSGISQSYLRSVELNEKNPTIQTISYICDALKISLADFFNESSEQMVPEDSLFLKIQQLNEQQRNALLLFLNTM